MQCSAQGRVQPIPIEHDDKSKEVKHDGNAASGDSFQETFPAQAHRAVQ